MRKLRLNLLGEPQIFLNDEPFEVQGPIKLKGIIYYLGVMQKSIEREDLAELLWPDVVNRIGRRYLSKHLVELREQLGEFLVITPKSLALLPPPAVTVDLHLVAVALSEAETSPGNTTKWRQAITWYRGPFLQGFKLVGASPFEQWANATNDEITLQVTEALYNLAETESEAGNGVQAHLDLDRLLGIMPWHEAAHRLKMLLLAQQAQYSAAIEQYRICRKCLAEELGVDPEPETEALLASIRNGEIVAEPDPRAIPVSGQTTSIDSTSALRNRKLPSPLSRSVGPPQFRRHVAPAPLTELLGRDELLELGVGYLRRPICRFVTVAGMWGIGKSHLALALVQKVAADFEHGVGYVSLADLEDPGHNDSDGATTIDAIANATVNALGLITNQDKRPTSTVEAYLQERQMLLLLDGFESFLAAAPWLTKLLTVAPRLTLLVTSRKRLNLPAEYLLSVEPLSFPSREALTDWDGAWATRWLEEWFHEDSQISDGQSRTESAVTIDGSTSRQTNPYPALQLLIARIRQRTHHFVPTATELTTLARICHAVDGLPLALEMVAQWSEHMSFSNIAQQLEEDLSLLQSTGVTKSEYHQGIEVLFADSWKLLTVNQQSHLLILSLFSGSFSLEAATTITESELSVLKELTDCSLLHLLDTGRYKVHFLIRQLAQEKLIRQLAQAKQSDGEGFDDSFLPRFWQAYCHYYLTLAAEEAPYLYGFEAPAAMAKLRLEIDNISQAWRQAVRFQLTDLLESVLDPLVSGYMRLGLLEEALQIVQLLGIDRPSGETKAIEGLDRNENNAEYEPTTDQQLDLSAAVDYSPYLLSLGYLLSAEIYWEQINYKLAHSNAEQALYFASQYKNVEFEIRSRFILGGSRIRMGRVQEAIAPLEEGLRQATQHDRVDLRVKVRIALALWAYYQNDFDLAIPHALAALADARQSRNLVLASLMLMRLGYFSWRVNQLDQAYAYLQEALSMQQELEIPHYEAHTLDVLAKLASVDKGIGQGIRYLQRSIERRKAFGEQNFRQHSYINLSWWYIQAGQYDEAEQYLQAGLQQHEANHALDGVHAYSYKLCVLKRLQKQPDAAIAYAKRALSLLDQSNQARDYAMVYCEFGQALIHAGEYQAAAENFQQGLTTTIARNRPYVEIIPLTGLAEVALITGNLIKAERYMEEVLSKLNLTEFYHEVAEPFRPDWICYRILHALDDPRQAEVVATAAEKLMKWADQIGDQELRQSALHNVVVNQQILEAAVVKA